MRFAVSIGSRICSGAVARSGASGCGGTASAAAVAGGPAWRILPCHTRMAACTALQSPTSS
eukprot:2097084-Amphidinium_carterae.1